MRNSGTNKQQYQIDRSVLKMSPQMSNSRHPMSNSKIETINHPPADHCATVNQWKMHQVPLPSQIHVNQYIAQQIQNHLKSSQNHLVCTCPPEVHKALLEQQLIQIPNHHQHAHLPAQHIPQIHFQPCQHQRQVMIKPVVSNPSVEPQSMCGVINQIPYGSQIKPTVVTSCCPESTNNNMTQSLTSNLSMSYPTSSLQPAICHSRQISAPETMNEARAQISKMESQILYLTSWIQNNFHTVNHLQTNSSSVNSQPTHVPPVTESISLSQHKNCLPCYIVTSDCLTSDFRDGHTNVEATPSNSSLDSAYSAKSTTSSDNNSGYYKLTTTGNCQIQSSPLLEEKIPGTVLNKISKTQAELKSLKQEIDALKRLNQSFRVNFKNECNDAFLKMKKLIYTTPGLNYTPVRKERTIIERNISDYTTDVNSEIEKLEDLEIAIEDLRMNVLNRKCRVNIDEVEMLALHLSRISKCLAINKADFPELEIRLKQILQTETEIIKMDEKFIQTEPKRLDSALKLCKKLISTLFTLKRLGSVQENTGSDSIPEIRSNRDPKPKDRQAILEVIRSIEPDHEFRMQQIELAEKLRECRRRMLTSHESLKFEKSLELAARTLRDIKLSPVTNSERISAKEDNRPNKISVGSGTRETDSLSSLTDSDVEPIVLKTETTTVNKDLPHKMIPEFIQRLPLINDLSHTSSSDTSNDQDSSDNASSSNSRSVGTLKLSSKLSSKQTTILKTSQHSSRSNRSSKVAFNRMVTVEDGSEVLQLNCPDDDYDDDLSSMTLTSPPPPPPPRLSSQDETVIAPEAEIVDENSRSNNIWYQQYHNSLNGRVPKTES